MDNASVGTALADVASAWSFTQPTELANSPHTVRVTARDSFGNTTASATNTFHVQTTMAGRQDCLRSMYR